MASTGQLTLGPGSQIPVRLQQITPNLGCFWVLVFAGEPLSTGSAIKEFRLYLDGDDSFATAINTDAVHFLTIIAGKKNEGDLALGVSRFGRIYYDLDNSCHSRYGFTTENGGVMVVRPDGMVGFVTLLAKGKEVGAYFANIFKDVIEIGS